MYPATKPNPTSPPSHSAKNQSRQHHNSHLEFNRLAQQHTMAKSCHFYFQTPPVTEFTTCETAIFYLTQNSLPNNLQCCRRHNFDHLINSRLLSHPGFVSSYGNTSDVRETLLALKRPPKTARYTSYAKNHLVHRTLPKARFNVLYKIIGKNILSNGLW